MEITFKVLATLASIIGSFAVISNFIICLTYFLDPQLLDAANIFILNISTGDLLCSIVELPMLVVSNARGEWSFGEAGCTAYGFLTTFFALGSLMNLAGAAYERYFTLCKLYDNGEAQFSRKKSLVTLYAIVVLLIILERHARPWLVKLRTGRYWNQLLCQLEIKRSEAYLIRHLLDAGMLYSACICDRFLPLQVL